MNNRFSTYLLSSLLLAITFCSNLLGQNNHPEEIILKGIIVSDSTHEAVSFARIINKRTSSFRLAGMDGDFDVRVKPYDTLVVTAVGFVSTRVIVDESVFNAPSTDSLFGFPIIELNLFIEESSYSLPEFTVFSYSREEFKHKFVHMHIPDSVYFTMPKITKADVGNMNPKTGAGVTINGPLTAIYNRFGKEGRTKHKIDKYRNVILKYKGMSNDSLPYFNTEQYYEQNKDDQEKEKD